MISGLLGRLSSGRSAANPPQAPTNVPSGGPQKNTISIAAVEAQLPPEKKIALATGNQSCFLHSLLSDLWACFHVGTVTKQAECLVYNKVHFDMLLEFHCDIILCARSALCIVQVLCNSYTCPPQV